MRILCVDVGTGTQDILCFDSARELENSIKLVMPAPTVVVAERIRAATRRREAILLTGVTMGGGPCAWAAEEHVRSGRPIYATPDAARTFDDDLGRVEGMGVRIVSEDEAKSVVGVTRIAMRDFWLDAVVGALERFGADTHFDAAAVAVFDHGAAPPGQSDRVFRFEYLAERVRAGHGLAGFAFPRDQIPARLTRLRAVAASMPEDLPALVMDTAPAAVLGALLDQRVAEQERCIIANIGNFHCLAFRLVDGAISGLFEHHTGELQAAQLEGFMRRLMDGSISNQEVFESNGHGALMFDAPVGRLPDFVAVTGPRRGLLRHSGLVPYFAAPVGDMMLAGCFGLLRAWALKDPRMADAVDGSLQAA